jgi:hypothetical protein
MFDTNIKAARKSIMELNKQQLIAIGEEFKSSANSTAITTSTVQKVVSKTHYIFIVDESGSMYNNLGFISSLFSSSPTSWEVLKYYMTDFLKNAATRLGSEDLISCVGFSKRACTRMNQVSVTEASKYDSLWEPKGG